MKIRPSIICLGGNIESLSIIQSVYARGYAPIVMTQSANDIAASWVSKHEKQGAELWLADIYSPVSARLRTHKKLGWTERRARDIQGVLCCAADTPDTQAALAGIFGVPTIGKESAAAGRDKWLQYMLLRDANLPVPPTEALTIHSTYADIADKGFGVIKPIAGRGARGVSRFTEQIFRDNLVDAIGNSLPGHKGAIAQRWISGIQLSTESIIYNGENLFTAVALRNYSRLSEFYPNVVEDGCDTPYYLSEPLTRNLNDLILRAATALGWDNCTVKGDIVLDKDVFYIIELAPRLSGGLLCSHIIPEAYGFDFVDAAINLCVGKKPKVDVEKNTRAVSQRYVFPKPEWAGKKIKSIVPAPVAAINEVLLYDLTVYKKPGDIIQPVTKHGDRLAQVICTASTLDRAKRLAEDAVQKVREGIIVE